MFLFHYKYLPPKQCPLFGKNLLSTFVFLYKTSGELKQKNADALLVRIGIFYIDKYLIQKRYPIETCKVELRKP